MVIKVISLLILLLFAFGSIFVLKEIKRAELLED